MEVTLIVQGWAFNSDKWLQRQRWTQPVKKKNILKLIDKKKQ